MLGNKQSAEQLEQVEQVESDATVEVEISVKLMSDGQITLHILNEEVRIEVVEDMLKKTYENINEQKIISKALEAFKAKLS